MMVNPAVVHACIVALDNTINMFHKKLLEVLFLCTIGISKQPARLLLFLMSREDVIFNKRGYSWMDHKAPTPGFPVPIF